MRFHHELEWLVSPWPTSIGLAAAYLALAHIGPTVLKDLPPQKLSGAKIVYNLAQVVVCSIVALNLLPYFCSAEHSWGLSIVPNETVEWWVFVYYCCKLLDFLDTFFMVLGKKTSQLTVLHLWHHASIVPLFGYFLSAGLGAGFVCTLPLLNSLVHVLMYSHYLATSLFTFTPREMWWKPWLTGAQIGHHLLLMVLMVANLVYGNPECTLAVAVSSIAWGVSILGLFLKFYASKYTGKQARKETEGEVGATRAAKPSTSHSHISRQRATNIDVAQRAADLFNNS